VPDKSIDKDKSYDRHHMLGILFDAKGDFIKAGAIAKKLDWPTKGTQIEVRKAITELIEIDNQPIISSSEGFALTTDAEKIKEYAEHLEGRKKGLQRRINKVWEIYERVVYAKQR
jgi:hypothetical protein